MIARCQQDAYLTEGKVEVLRCEPAGDHFELIVADSLLYPEGGGQPADHGAIGYVRITDAQRRGEQFAWRAESAVEPGLVRVVVDWQRRFDHMQQHTAQHLITAIAHDRFDLPTVAFHLGGEDCTIDLQGPTPSPAVLRQIEAAANQAIRNAIPVSHQMVTVSEYETMEVRSRGLPDGHTGDVRLVTIEGIDTNTCGGTHVRNTAELQMVLLTGFDEVKGGIRLHYLAGDRIGSRLRGTLRHESDLNAALSCGQADHLAAIQKMRDERRSIERQARRYKKELGLALGDGLAAQRVAHRHFVDADMGFLQSIAATIANVSADALVLLTAASAGDLRRGVFLLAGPAEQVSALGPAVATKLEGRGGGAKGRYQGKAERLDNAALALQLLVSSTDST